MQEVRAKALGWLGGKRAEMEAALERLVNIDSSSFDKEGVDRVADALAELLPGIATERLPVEGFGDAMRATLPGSGGGNKPVLLLGHRDTVFPKGTLATRRFRREGDTAYGPGVADMKAGLVQICFVLRALQAAGGAPFPVVALFTGDEEIGSRTSRAFIEAEARGARAVLNAEPGRVNGNVVAARKGGISLRIEVTGRAAHAGAAFTSGISAIGALAEKIIRLHALTDLAAGITVNVGTVKGGVVANMVAPSAEAEVDIRSVTVAGLDAVKARVAAIVAEEQIPGASASMTELSRFLPMEEQHSRDLLARYQEEARALGFAVEGEFSGGCSDSGVTASLGVPSLCGLGPVGGLAHTEQEYCRLETLVPRAQAMAATLLSLA